MCDTCTSLLTENGQLTEEISGLLYTTRKQASENAALRSELRKRDVEDPANAEIVVLLENWLRLCRSRKTFGRKPNIEPGTKRWKIARTALRREGSQQICLEAIEGLALLPYVTNHGRAADGLPSQRYDDIEYALKDETTVERCRKYRARVLGADEEALFGAWTAADTTAQLYLTAWFGKYNRERAERPPDNVVALYARRQAA